MPMKYPRLAQAIRSCAEQVMVLRDGLTDEDPEFHKKERTLSDANTLMHVLANVAEGKPLLWAMGSPGDWGRSTQLGQALVNALQEPTAPPDADKLLASLTDLLNDPAVVNAAQPGDIGRALCAVRGI